MKEKSIRLKKESVTKSSKLLTIIVIILLTAMVAGILLVYYQMKNYNSKVGSIENNIGEISDSQEDLRSDIININSIIKVMNAGQIGEQTIYQALSSNQLTVQKSNAKVDDALDKLNTPTWDKSDNDITNLTYASEEEFNKIIDDIITSRKMDENNPMRGKGYLLKKIEDDYGISGNAILSIITWETNFCTECPAYNNVCCVRTGNEFTNFNSIDECILYLGELLDSYINDYDLHTWDEIGNRYCDYRWTINIPSTILAYNDMMWEVKFNFKDDRTE